MLDRFFAVWPYSVIENLRERYHTISGYDGLLSIPTVKLLVNEDGLTTEIGLSIKKCHCGIGTTFTLNLCDTCSPNKHSKSPRTELTFDTAILVIFYLYFMNLKKKIFKNCSAKETFRKIHQNFSFILDVGNVSAFIVFRLLEKKKIEWKKKKNSCVVKHWAKIIKKVFAWPSLIIIYIESAHWTIGIFLNSELEFLLK